MASKRGEGAVWDLSKYSAADLVFMARLAEQAERYEEMKDFMKKVAQDQGMLGQEERNLMSVAYKNVVGARRASWRVLSSLLKAANSQLEKSCLQKYIAEVEEELTQICEDILDLLTTYLMQNQQILPEQKVFYCKMKGDYHRYMAEYSQGDAKTETNGNAQQAYKEAMEAAKALTPTNPIRLGLALNFSVFYYEILENPKEACGLAKEAFDQAVGELEDLNEEEYKDATLIMQLLRDNLTLWQTEDQEDDAAMDQDGTVLEDCDF